MLRDERIRRIISLGRLLGRPPGSEREAKTVLRRKRGVGKNNIGFDTARREKAVGRKGLLVIGRCLRENRSE